MTTKKIIEKMFDLTPEIILYKDAYNLTVRKGDDYSYFSTGAGILCHLKRENIKIEPEVEEKLKNLKTKYVNGRIYIL